jgi:predicted phosphodiesterase
MISDFSPFSERTTRRVATAAAAVVLGLVGGWLGLVLGGTVHHEVGPLTTSMRVHPTWGGDTTLQIPPLGEMVLDTHSGPLGLEATLQGVDVEEAQQIMQNPQLLQGLRARAEADLRWELQMAVLRAVTAGLVGATALSLLALRRVRVALLSTATAATAMATAGVVAFTTWNPAALAEPRYTGLLTSAPAVVGSADDIVNDFDLYGNQLARIVENVTGLYAVSSNLPLLPPENELVRVLHVSDLHLAPHSWSVIQSVAQQYRVNVVVDSGDITDHGSRPENRYLEQVGELDVPYVWVRGNHDSITTERAMRKIPNAVVLDGKIRKVQGLTFLGDGDPTFTPDKSAGETREPTQEAVAQAAQKLADTAEEAGGVDVMVYHDPTPAATFDGRASMALSGHLHYRRVRQGDEGTWLMVQGSTGGSGLRALEPEEPAAIKMSVLYIDRDSGELRAYDDISLGGLGLASAEINREIVADPEPPTEQVAPDRSTTPPERPGKG